MFLIFNHTVDVEIKILLLFFPGRFQYFAWMSNPMNGLVGNQSLLDAKKLLEQYKEGKEPEGTTREEVEIFAFWNKLIRPFKMC